ncbi:unnamed protein product [Durusdinium trenchii]|uniref:Uncharacterized protein n=1 Tax=Durusdinium trenchii TaxID=1381693 RepID=A0ABP0N9L3_9DINO
MAARPKERLKRACEEPPEPPAVPQLPRPQSAHRQARKQEQQTLHQPALPRKVRPPQLASARPVLKPSSETQLAPLLHPASVVAASRLMQEAYTSDTDLGETTDEEEIQRWSPPSSASEGSDGLVASAWRAVSRLANWLTPAPLERFWGKVHCQMLPEVCCSPPLQPPDEAKTSITVARADVKKDSRS